MIEGEYTEEEAQDIFEEFFFRDIEKWFSADIACCDTCYDDFVNDWPLVESFNESEFEQSGWDLEAIYSGGLLREHFTLEEFRDRIAKIQCPNCFNTLEANIWAYNMPIDIPKDIQDKIFEIGNLARTTPSLVLTHNFAKEIFDEVMKLGQEQGTTEIGLTGCRARSNNGKELTVPDFHWPAQNITVEGRYNHAGMPVWYISDDAKTCFHELKKPSEGIFVADIEIEGELKVLDLVKKLSEDGNLFQALVWSPLLSSNEHGDGWHRPQYAFTRFISDCAKNAGFDAIRFPSVRLGSGHNLCILDPESFKGKFTISNIRIVSY